MIIIGYIGLILGLSWPILIAAYGVSWLVLRKRRSYKASEVLYFVLVSLVLFLGASFALSIAWLPQFGQPMLNKYVYGPALVAAVLVFPVMCWWLGRKA